MICRCNVELIWGGCHSYEEYGLDGDGTVYNYSCENDDCNVDSVLVYEEEKE